MLLPPGACRVVRRRRNHTQVPPEWQSSAFSQHSASWGCAYLAAPALIAWAGDSADAILTVATVTMVISAAIVEITFVDTRPEGHRTQRMSRVVSDYLLEGASNLAEVAIEGARDLAEVCVCVCVCVCVACVLVCWDGRYCVLVFSGGRRADQRNVCVYQVSGLKNDP